VISHTTAFSLCYHCLCWANSYALSTVLNGRDSHLHLHNSPCFRTTHLEHICVPLWKSLFQTHQKVSSQPGVGWDTHTHTHTHTCLLFHLLGTWRQEDHEFEDSKDSKTLSSKQNLNRDTAAIAQLINDIPHMLKALDSIHSATQMQKSLFFYQ
jgi:hypothetical protein